MASSGVTLARVVLQMDATSADAAVARLSKHDTLGRKLERGYTYAVFVHSKAGGRAYVLCEAAGHSDPANLFNVQQLPAQLGNVDGDACCWYKPCQRGAGDAFAPCAEPGCTRHHPRFAAYDAMCAALPYGSTGPALASPEGFGGVGVGSAASGHCDLQAQWFPGWGPGDGPVLPLWRARCVPGRVVLAPEFCTSAPSAVALWPGRAPAPRAARARHRRRQRRAGGQEGAHAVAQGRAARL